MFKTSLLSIVIAWLAISSASVHAENMEPIELPKANDEIVCHRSPWNEIAIQEMKAYCKAQNDQVRAAGYPACADDQCMDQLMLQDGAGPGGSLAFTLRYGGIYGDLSLVLVYYVGNPLRTGNRVICNPVDPDRYAYSLDQLDLLRAVMDRNQREREAGCPVPE